MSKCTDTNIGIQLHAYEMGQLSGEEATQFEMHLMECRFCFKQIENFEPAIVMLRSDSDLKNIVTEAVADRQTSNSWFKMLLNQLWPNTSLMLKPAVVYFLLALMIYPAYLGLQKYDQSTIDEVVTVMLTSNRATAVPVAVNGDDLVVLFRINGATKGTVYQVKIISEDGNQLYINDNFTNFDEFEMASLLVRSEHLVSGVYSVEILKLEDKSFNLKYIFTIK